MKLSKEDFKASITAEGYFITYKGKGIGGASILGKSRQRGKARVKQMQDYAEQAQRCIDQIVSGGGANHMRDTVEQINLQEILNASGMPHINVINKSSVWTMVDGEKEVFHADDEYGGHPLSGLASYGNVQGDHRMISAIAEDMQAAFELINQS